MVVLQLYRLKFNMSIRTEILLIKKKSRHIWKPSVGPFAIYVYTIQVDDIIAYYL